MNFRSHTILDYDPLWNAFRKTEYGLDYCGLIGEDYKLLAAYFDLVRRHAAGEVTELPEIFAEVY